MTSERVPGASGRRCRVAGLAVTFAVATLAGACSLDITAGGEVVPETFSLTVNVTNVGNGSGHVDVIFPAGTPETPCPDVLGPGESCSPTVKTSSPVQSVDLEASAESDSRFVEWGGACAEFGTSSECAVTEIPGDIDRTVSVEVRFDLR